MPRASFAPTRYSQGLFRDLTVIEGLRPAPFAMVLGRTGESQCDEEEGVTSRVECDCDVAIKCPTRCFPGTGPSESCWREGSLLPSQPAPHHPMFGPGGSPRTSPGALQTP